MKSRAIVRTSPAQIAALLKFLLDDSAGDVPDLSLELVRAHWLGAFVHVRLDGRDAPGRALFARDFADSFTRRAALDREWRRALAAFDAAHIPVLTLGSLGFGQLVYPHPAAKLSQDIDLLFAPADAQRAYELLRGVGWEPAPQQGMWRMDAGETADSGCGPLTLELDPHVTPGDDSRYPALAHAFGQTTERLFRHAARDSVTGALLPRWEATLDNRVIHWFKHYCQPLRHGVELVLMLRRPADSGALRDELTQSRSGPLWAFTLELLRRWGFDAPLDPTTEPDRAFACRPAVARVIEACSRLEGGRSPMSVAAMLLPPARRAQLALQIAWPPRKELLRMSGYTSAGALTVARLRLRRTGQFLAAAVTRR